MAARSSSASPDNNQEGVELEDSGLSNSYPLSEHDMTKEKERPRLEILVDSDCLFLKGTGSDVEPALLSGHVALNLTESTSFKEITLKFRGKARLPFTESSSRPSTYIVCNHDWTFLEGEKKQRHTLKAGRHMFPFQLQIGGSLPSSISTDISGGACISYKLRAHAARTGLSRDFQAVSRLSIVRSFTTEALEYQQTLEIENTWPGKLMYSIMLPHKAWAAGDKLTAQVKFMPIAKGMRVLSVATTINETTQMTGKSGSQEHVRAVGKVFHQIIDGQPEPVDPNQRKHRFLRGPTSGAHSLGHATSRLTTRNFSHPHHPSGQILHISPDSGPSSGRSSDSNDAPAEDLRLNQIGEVDAFITIDIPSNISPSHNPDPINISHRIRWSIMIANPDGHTSELRCSLPIHLLDNRLLNEARSATVATRRLLLGSDRVPADQEDAPELPSYTSHLRDRVMILPGTGEVQVVDPTVNVDPLPDTLPATEPGTQVQSGHSSPHGVSAVSQLPQSPGSGSSAPLEWVNSELMSLANQGPRSPIRRVPVPVLDSELEAQATIPMDSRQQSTSRPPSRPPSRRQSKRRIRPMTADSASGSGRIVPQEETFTHSSTHASRTLHGVFDVSMKPVSSLPHRNWLSNSRSASRTDVSVITATPAPSRPTSPTEPQRHTHNRRASLPIGPRGASLRRTFNDVPDYENASRGFTGGVPTMTSMRGLPSYAEVQGDRSRAGSTMTFTSQRSTRRPRTRG